MYWQKRFYRENPDKEIEDKILEIRDTHKDYGYRRVVGELRNQGYCVNKKKVQRIMQKLVLQVTSFTRKSRKYSSYQGWAYQMKAYSHRLKEERIFQSMSRKGNCHDNAVMENFFGLLKQEIYYGVTYYSYDELKSEIERYIKYYNEQRIKEKLGWLSPVQYRLRLLAA